MPTPPPKKKFKMSVSPMLPAVASILEEIKENNERNSAECPKEGKSISSNETLLTIELDMTSQEKHKKNVKLL